MDAYVATVSENRRIQTVRRKITYLAQLKTIQALYLCRIHGRIMFEKTILGRYDGLTRKLLFTGKLQNRYVIVVKCHILSSCHVFKNGVPSKQSLWCINPVAGPHNNI